MNSKIENGRPDFALAEVKRFIEKQGVDKDKYRSHCLDFPTMVQTNGLAATVAFAFEKGGEWHEVNKSLNKWLKRQGYLDGWLKSKNVFENEKRKEAVSDKLFIEYVCSLESAYYRIVTKETLALFSWIRRFAAGLIKGEK